MRKLWAGLNRLVLLMAIAILIANAVIVGLRFQAVGIAVLLAMTYRLTRRRWQVSGAYGTARIFSTVHDLLSARLLGARGLIFGRVGQMGRPTRMQALRSLLSPRVPAEWAVRLFLAAFLGSRRIDDFIRINDITHVATFAPAGGGKTTAVLAPNLLSYEGNCVVVDKGGELFKLTAAHRKKHFGHTIVRLDPGRLYGQGDCFNPLDRIDPRCPEFIDVCRDLANMLVVRTGKEPDTHWVESAENVGTAFISYICAFEGNPAARNMRGVRKQLASRANYASALERMQGHEGFYGVLEDLGNSMTWHVEKELGSVMSSTQRFTHIFGSPLVAACTSSTTFKPEELRTGRMTVYITIPPDRMVVWQGLTRIWLGSLLRIITRGVPTEKNPVLFLVDECAHIGKMQALEDAITLLRGSGIKVWLFFQSLNQLQKCFGENAGTVLDNLTTQQYMSITSYETAEALSKRIGTETIVIRSEGDNRGTSSPVGGDSRNPGSHNSGSNTSFSEAARPLFRPEEILVLPEHTAIVFHKNHYAVVCNKIRYFSDHAFRRRGIAFRGWGTGRTKGLGLGEMVVGLALLALSLGVTLFVARLPALVQQQPPAVSHQRIKPGSGIRFVPAPYRPARRPYSGGRMY